MAQYLFDTDPGIDDAVAITLALGSGADVAGLCIVAGNVEEPVAAANAASLLAALDRDVPIHRGASRPLVRARLDAGGVHGVDGLGGALARVPAPRGGATAVQRLLVFEDTLVAIGPLTNVAAAALADPGWPGRLRRLIVMGGALRAGGNVTAAAEFNFLADPEAAAVVLGAGFGEVRLVPLDCRAECGFGPAQLARLQAIDTVPARTVATLLGGWREPIAAAAAGGGPVIWDAVAWLAAAAPGVFAWEPLHVEVDLGRGVAYGACITDRRRAAPPPNLLAYAGCDVAAMWHLFFGALGEGGGARPV